MATLSIPQNGKASKGKTTKQFIGVDLTAMVDLAFLLITFFMLTTSLSTKTAMDIVEPADGPTEFVWPESRTMTILLGKNNQAVWYMGTATTAAMLVTDLAAIRKQILANKLTVAKAHGDSKGRRMLVIIKPTPTAIYKNFVDIIDEMNINGIETYAIDDKNILPEERAFLERNRI